MSIYVCINTVYAVLPKTEDNPLPINSETDLLWYIHTMEYHSAMNKEQLLTQLGWISQILYQTKKVRVYTAWFYLQEMQE